MLSLFLSFIFSFSYPSPRLYYFSHRLPKTKKKKKEKDTSKLVGRESKVTLIILSVENQRRLVLFSLISPSCFLLFVPFLTTSRTTANEQDILNENETDINENERKQLPTR